jgi:hypothetical protein
MRAAVHHLSLRMCSDFLGVALGTASLEIAKAGLRVDPSFWIIDLFAIVLGCLLGVFMPVLLKHSESLAQGWRQYALRGFALANILFIFLSVFFAGITYIWDAENGYIRASLISSGVFLAIPIVCLLLMIGVALRFGGPKKSAIMKCLMQHLIQSNVDVPRSGDGSGIFSNLLPDSDLKPEL